MNKGRTKSLIQLIFASLFVFVSFFLVNTSVKANDVQDLINQNDSLVVNQPKAKTQAASISAYSVTNSGTFGTCDWDIDDTGLLTIHAGVLGAGMGNWNKALVTSVYVDPGVVANSNSIQLFSNLTNVTSVDITNLDTSNVIDFSSFFSYDSKLQNIIGIEEMNTSSATNMSSMFNSNSALISLDVSNFDTSKVTNMASMFQSCRANITGLKNFDTSKVTNMSTTFSGTQLTNTDDIKNWDTANVSNMSSMFAFNYKMTSIDLSNWDKTKVVNISGMFTSDAALTEINGLKEWDTSNITNMSSLFMNTKFSGLPEIENWNTSSVSNMSKIFYQCTNLNNLDLSNWNTDNVTNMSYMFGSDAKLNENNLIGIDKFNTAKVKDFGGMFSGTGFTVLDLSNFDTSSAENLSKMFFSTKSLTKIIGEFNTSKVNTLSGIFSGSAISDFSGLNIADWDTSKVTDFSSAFYQTNFTSLPEIINWNTGSAEKFNSMFSQMSNLTDLDLSKWNTSNVTNMSSMFSMDKNLNNLDISNFDTGKVQNFSNMFYSIGNIDKIDTSNWNTSSATNMNHMFYSSGIKILDTSSWNTSKVTDMTSMFGSASSLGKLDLSNWDMSNVKSMDSMFDGANSLWSLGLGPKVFFTDDVSLPQAYSNHLFTDQEENKQYTSISGYWQAVGEDIGGTPHSALGQLISNDDLAALYSKQGGPTATYVPQQTPLIDMKMDVPDLSFSKTGSNKMVVHRQESNWGITVTNNTFPAQYVKGDVKVKMSKDLTDANGNSLNGSLIFRDYGKDDQVIGSDDTTIATRSFQTSDSTISWSKNEGFLMDFDGSTVKAGDYSGTLTWTLQNSL